MADSGSETKSIWSVSLTQGLIDKGNTLSLLLNSLEETPVDIGIRLYEVDVKYEYDYQNEDVIEVPYNETLVFEIIGDVTNGMFNYHEQFHPFKSGNGDVKMTLVLSPPDLLKSNVPGKFEFSLPASIYGKKGEEDDKLGQPLEFRVAIVEYTEDTSDTVYFSPETTRFMNKDPNVKTLYQPIQMTYEEAVIELAAIGLEPKKEPLVWKEWNPSVKKSYIPEKEAELTKLTVEFDKIQDKIDALSPSYRIIKWECVTLENFTFTRTEPYASDEEMKANNIKTQSPIIREETFSSDPSEVKKRKNKLANLNAQKTKLGKQINSIAKLLDIARQTEPPKRMDNPDAVTVDFDKLIDMKIYRKHKPDRPAGERKQSRTDWHIDPLFGVACARFFNFIHNEYRVSKVYNMDFIRPPKGPTDGHPSGKGVDISGFEVIDDAGMAHWIDLRSGHQPIKKEDVAGDVMPSDQFFIDHAKNDASDWYNSTDSLKIIGATMTYSEFLMKMGEVMTTFFGYISGPCSNAKHQDHFHAQLRGWIDKEHAFDNYQEFLMHRNDSNSDWMSENMKWYPFKCKCLK